MKVAKVEMMIKEDGWKPKDIRKLSTKLFPAYTNCITINPPIIAKSSRTCLFLIPIILIISPPISSQERFFNCFVKLIKENLSLISSLLNFSQ